MQIPPWLLLTREKNFGLFLVFFSPLFSNFSWFQKLLTLFSISLMKSLELELRFKKKNKTEKKDKLFDWSSTEF